MEQQRTRPTQTGREGAKRAAEGGSHEGGRNTRPPMNSIEHGPCLPVGWPAAHLQSMLHHQHPNCRSRRRQSSQLCGSRIGHHLNPNSCLLRPPRGLRPSNCQRQNWGPQSNSWLEISRTIKHNNKAANKPLLAQNTPTAIT